MAQIPSQTCTFCSKIAELFCYDCKQCLCTQCQKDIHGIVAVCRDHKVGDIHKAGNRIYKPVPTCEVHYKEFLYYCSKCDCLICKECITSSHNGHITKEIKNIADIHRQDVNKIINTLKTKVEEIKETLKTIDVSHSLQIQSDCDLYIENVQKTSQEINQIIDRNKLINITTATDFRENEKQDLKRKRVFYQRLDNEYSDRLLKFENILLEQHDGTFFTEWKGLQTELQIMTEESEQQVSGPRRIDRFNQNTFIRAVIEDFDNQFQMRLQEKEIAFAKLSSEVSELRAEVKSKQRKIDGLSKEQEENTRMQKTILKLEKDLEAVRIENDTSLATVALPMPEGWTLTDLKLKEVETELSIISPEIFVFRSKDAKTLTLKGNQYEKLQLAKTKCEFILGIEQQGRSGLRARVMSTEGNGQMGNKSFSQSVTPSSSSFSQSLSRGSSFPSVHPPCAASFKTSEGVLIHVYVGNILNLKVDCIVNPANETLSHGGGLSNVISRTAGYGFQQESDDYIQRHGQLNVTECCTTSAGSLPYQCVIHAVGPRWYNYKDKSKCAFDLEETVQNCFKVAEKKMMNAVAVPAISSGIFGIPKKVCCKAYGKAVQDFSRKHGNTICLKEIHFVDKDAGMISMIQKEFTTSISAQ